jgi:acyl-CoA synthetase (AMP-forming)/AMP-acid ligase II
MSTVRDLVDRGRPNATAISAPNRRDLDYAGLAAHVDALIAALNARGIGRDDRVAIVLPNGPEMATAFIAISCAATTAPLNPVYREEEFDFYLNDLNAKALIVETGSRSPAVAAAKRRNIPIFEIAWGDDDPAGIFRFSSGGNGSPAAGGPAGENDIALVLHTSGTTSRPKIVPLSHRNVTASAANIVASLKLGPGDRCLNVMPLFHIHGLIAATLASIAAGGSIYCTPGFNALSFFGWLRDAAPTWYTAVPTMHQAILSRAARNTDEIAKSPLRFVRSSSASLPPQVMAELEETFGAPVIESYGMTEASHQMASNPLPGAPRKPGTVGLPAGPEVEVMGEDGMLLAPGGIGEIVIRGSNVFSGYENNPEANATAFADGWFRTGDQGTKDADGYISITGRLKEIINRGGEKISPREVDEIIMSHPAVAQVVTFALPHPKLGEDVAAAIVLREGREVTEKAIREFAGRHLADFKVPHKVIFLDEIPKGATGKLQRIGLAEKLGLA